MLWPGEFPPYTSWVAELLGPHVYVDVQEGRQRYAVTQANITVGMAKPCSQSALGVAGLLLLLLMMMDIHPPATYILLPPLSAQSTPTTHTHAPYGLRRQIHTVQDCA